MTPTQLRRLLKRLVWSQVEAARRLKVDPRTVRRWVAGERRIPESAAMLLATWAKKPPKR